MNYCDLITPHDIAKLYDWLRETGGLNVRLEWPHHGCGGMTYWPSSLTELRELIRQQTHTELIITFFEHEGMEAEVIDHLDDRRWIHEHSKDVIQIRISRNQSKYEPYVEHPDRYRDAEALWKAESIASGHGTRNAS